MHSTVVRIGMACIVVLALVVMTGPQGAHAATGPRCYVDRSAVGLNNGNTWANAYLSLQSALGDANCDEVWVADGVYKPTSSTSDRTATFTIRPGMQVYGGFAGGEGSLEARTQIASHPTVLSGDIDSNDANGDGNYIAETWSDINAAGTNSYRVVTMDGTGTPITTTTVLDGFIITAGHNDRGGFPDGFGAGLFCDGAGSGKSCSPSLRQLVFSGNYVSAGYGGGIYARGQSAGSVSPVLSEVTFTGNRANSAGAMYSDAIGGSGDPTLTNVTFSSNTATDYGGALYTRQGSPVLTNVTFYSNSAYSGGAYYNESCNGASGAALTNVTFNLNTATYGGAIVNDGGCGVGGIPQAVLRNVILWGNTATTSGPQVYNSNGGTANIDASVVQGGCAIISGAACLDNVIGDPQLGPLQDNGGFTPTMALQEGSAALNTGTNTVCPATDQRGVRRPQGATCDIGAYEAPFAAIRGNAGFPGTVLTYTDGTLHTVTADASGDYYFEVTDGWSGTVTPSKARTTFTPPSTTYASVTHTYFDQDYSVTWKVVSIAANDGWVLESSENSEQGGTRNYSAETFRLGDDAANRQYRAILAFNTSELPDTAVITAVTLKFKPLGAVGTNPFNTGGNRILADIKKGVFGSAAGLQLGDFQAAASHSAALSYSNVLVKGWYSKLLSAADFAYVNKMGQTQFRLRFSVPDNNDLGADYLRFYSANAATGAYRPVLLIRFYMP